MKTRIILFFLLMSLLCLFACGTEPVGTTGGTTASTTAATTPPTTKAPSAYAGVPVFINEVCSKNYGSLTGYDGGDYDWIELWNAGDSYAKLAGWSLSDDPADPLKYVFPKEAVIYPHSRMIVFCPGSDFVNTRTGVFYVPFKISADDTLTLYSPDGETHDRVTVPDYTIKNLDLTWARLTDGEDEWGVCHATPAASNDGTGYFVMRDDLITVSHGSGFYDETFSVTLGADEGYTLLYTTDSSDPATSETAKEWDGTPISVYDKTADHLKYATYLGFTPDEDTSAGHAMIDKCFVLRVSAVDKSGSISDPITRVYFVGYDGRDGYGSMPVVCLTSDPDGLFSTDGGLLVLNRGESKWSATTHDGRDWERRTNFTMFSAEGEYLFDQDVGIRVRGTSTRGMMQKSLNVYARSEYGDKAFGYDLFDNGVRTRSVILRNDSSQGHVLGQGYLQDLVEDRDILTQRNIPVIVFLDGEYYGIFTLYERFCEDYVEDHWGVDNDNIWTAKKFAGSWGAEFDAPTTEGLLAAQEDLNSLFEYIGKHDLSVRENWDYVCSRMDMTSLIDILCAQLYLGNVDFSLAQNISAWRAAEPDPTNPWADGRWRFVMYDLDFTLDCSGSGKSFTWSSDPFRDDQPWAGGGFLQFKVSTNYFKLSGDTLVKDSSRPISYNFAEKMMKSPYFRELFVTTFQDMANFDFSLERVKALTDPLYDVYQAAYPTYRKRVNDVAYANDAPDVDDQLRNNLKNKYKKNLTYFEKRAASVTEDLASAFSLKGTRDKVTISIEGADDASIRVNTATATVTSGASVTAYYYTDYQLTLTAADTDDFVFLRWEITGATAAEELTSETVTLTLTKSADVTIKAVYAAK